MIVIDPYLQTVLHSLAALAQTDLTPKQADILAKIGVNVEELSGYWATINPHDDAAGVLHHDLSNAITPIVGYVTALGKGMAGPLDDTQWVLVRAMHEAITALRVEVRRLGDIAAT